MANEREDDRFPDRIVARGRSCLRPAVLLATRHRRRTVCLRPDARMEPDGDNNKRLHSISNHAVLSCLYCELRPSIFKKKKARTAREGKQPN